MPADTQTAPVSKKSLWAGRTMSALVILFLTFDVVLKFVKPAPAPVVEGKPTVADPSKGGQDAGDPAKSLPMPTPRGQVADTRR